MSEHAHPAFVEDMHTGLVVSRRNTKRALASYAEGDLVMLKFYLDALDEAIEALYWRAVNEEGRNVRTCDMGHAHYVQEAE